MRSFPLILLLAACGGDEATAPGEGEGEPRPAVHGLAEGEGEPVHEPTPISGAGEGEGEPPAPVGEGEGEGEGEPPPDPPGPEPHDGPVAYRAGRRHSPVTGWVARRWRQIVEAGEGRRDVFIKVGASATVNRHFLHCFADPAGVRLAGRAELQETLDAFSPESFTRQSLTATVGWSAWKAIAPDADDPRGRSPLRQELDAMNPAVAVVMYGTNDIQGRSVDRYGDSMLTLTQTLVEAGVVPILTTIMPRDDDPDADLRVPVYNGVVRAVAQALQVPLIDYETELRALADHGVGRDGIHTTTGGAGGCDLTAAGLLGGTNVRNLLTLQALDRVRRAALGPGEPSALDGAAGPVGDTVTSLPFVAQGDTSASPPGRLDLYSGCDADQDESGPEDLYPVDLGRDVRLRAVVIDQGDVDIDLHVLAPAAEEADCRARAHTELTVGLPGGSGFLSLDTFVNREGRELSGEYLLVVIQDPAAAAPAACDPQAPRLPNEGLTAPAGLDGCPDGMAPIAALGGEVCIDRWEASLQRLDGSEWSPYHHPQDRPVRALSRPDAVPQGYIDADTAAAACAAAGKRLCTDEEWLAACQGPAGDTYPYGADRRPGACNDARDVHPAVELFPDDPTPFDRIQDACINQLPDSLAAAGSHDECVTDDGVYDLMGNLHEWTASPTGTFRGGFYVDTERNGPGCLYATTAHNRAHWDYSTGFRCCADQAG